MDITATEFEREVIESSHQQLVLVDFWAPWCGPCRALTPVLEKLAAEYAGRVKLAKVNSDEEPEISAAFGVRSIPNVFAFRNGKAVSQFLGALSEGEVRAFIDKLLPPPQLALAERAIADLRLDEAERLLDEIKSNIDWDARVETLRQALAFARAGGGEKDLAAKVVADPADLDSRLALAGALAARHDYRGALEQLLEIIRSDREWKDREARKQMLAIFSLAADDPGLVSEYRKKLSALLY
ncbi:MAG: thioredoxin [Burkholderiales bacterium]